MFAARLLHPNQPLPIPWPLSQSLLHNRKYVLAISSASISWCSVFVIYQLSARTRRRSEPTWRHEDPSRARVARPAADRLLRLTLSSPSPRILQSSFGLYQIRSTATDVSANEVTGVLLMTSSTLYRAALSIWQQQFDCRTIQSV